MATLKEEVSSFLDLTGANDAESARSIISDWREKAAFAETNENASAQLAEICSVFGVTDPADAIAGMNTMRNQLNDIYAHLGEVKNQADAVSVIAKFQAENSGFKTRITELEGTQQDFEKRVNQEVINRAASAGITEPVKKEVTKTAAENVMVRSEFAVMPSGAQMQFIRAGGKLVD